MTSQLETMDRRKQERLEQLPRFTLETRKDWDIVLAKLDLSTRLLLMARLEEYERQARQLEYEQALYNRPLSERVRDLETYRENN